MLPTQGPWPATAAGVYSSSSESLTTGLFRFEAKEVLEAAVVEVISEEAGVAGEAGKFASEAPSCR